MEGHPFRGNLGGKGKLLGKDDGVTLLAEFPGKQYFGTETQAPAGWEEGSITYPRRVLKRPSKWPASGKIAP